MNSRENCNIVAVVGLIVMLATGGAFAADTEIMGTTTALEVVTSGTAMSDKAIYGYRGNSALMLGISSAILGENSDGVGVIGLTNTGATGVYGAALAGHGVYGVSLSGINGGVYGRNDNASGYGVSGQSFGNGIGVYAHVSGTGNSLVADHSGASGNVAVFQSSSANVARISKSGVGYFNGGTQNTGADLAELFDVEGNRDKYEPGDVLAISLRADRTVALSSEANSARVVGVYATKPGVLLSDLHIDEDISARVPVGVLGVIPTKVSGENGSIRRGDLIVTAATPGYAMKAGASPAAGTVLGKALQEFVGPGTGLILVLVNVK
ncbi:MAG: hypothetical protein C0402_05630 [Thermodesulfovibrio sp.]|nr:hypothetical protein [Thermodesulfovibrio sp.]